MKIPWYTQYYENQCFFWKNTISQHLTAWKVSKYGVFSGMNAGKCSSEKSLLYNIYDNKFNKSIRGVFKTQSHICDGVFLRKKVIA